MKWVAIIILVVWFLLDCIDRYEVMGHIANWRRRKRVLRYRK